MERYERFYREDWGDRYGFWHRVITKGKHQIRILKEIISGIEGNPVNILDLGCGKGDEIKEAVDSIKNKEFQITANDTSKEALDEYSRSMPSYVREVINDRLEDVPGKVSGKFDLILFSHCLYGAELKGLFRRYLELLSENGVILIFLDSEKSTIKKTQERFWREIHGVPFNENTGESIVKELSSDGIEHESRIFHSYMDMGKLEEIDKDGVTRLLIPFLARTRDLDKGIVGRIVDYIRKLEKDRKLDNETFAIIIRK